MPWAVLFDMNGVLINDMGFHKQAWRVFRQQVADRIPLGRTDRDLTGRTNREIFSILLNREISPRESQDLEAEKEDLYRQIYRPHLKAVPGLKALLARLKAQAVPVGLATSGPPANVDFILDGLKIRAYFNVVVDASQIDQGKPHPEVFLTAAGRLGILPERCLVFEDSPLGIRGARRAGMQVIGVTTTHAADELQGAILTIPDFKSITLDQLETIAAAPLG